MNHCDFNNCILHIYIIFFLVNQLRLPIGEIKLLLTYLLTYFMRELENWFLQLFSVEVNGKFTQRKGLIKMNHSETKIIQISKKLHGFLELSLSSFGDKEDKIVTLVHIFYHI